MLPPSESILHRIHKIAQPQNGPENPEAATPPPPYSPRDPSPPKQIDGENALQWAAPRPIAIHIDASISVLGNANSIILPSIPVTSPSSPPSSTAILQSAQRHRQSKLTDMATSIIAALHRTGLLNPSEDNESLPSVMLNINAGIKVQGTRNVICLGRGVMGRKITTEQGLEREEEHVGHVERKRRAQSEPLESYTGKKEARRSL